MATRASTACVAFAAAWLAACGSSAGSGSPPSPTSAVLREQQSASPPSRCPAERVSEPEPSSGLVEALAPLRRWPLIGGREQGLLLPARSRWGTLVAWSPIAGQLVFSAGLDGYTFSSRGTNPWLLYFRSSGEGQNFLRNWQRPLADGSIGHFDAASFGPRTPNPWGLSRPAHIVEVEVNGGRGGGSDLHFVATDVRILDRTAALPLDPERALDEAGDCFAELEATTRSSLAATLERASASVTYGPTWEPEVERRIEAIAPTFDPESRRLRIVHALRVVRTRTKRESISIVPNCPPGAPCMPPREETTVRVRGYGADLAEELEFDADGRRLFVRAHGPVALSNDVLVRAGLARDSETP